MRKVKKIIFCCLFILFFTISNVVFAATGTVTGKTVRIRENADANSKIVTNAYRNDKVNIIETLDGWYKVEFEGKTGYISKDYVELKEETSTQPTDNQTPNTQPTDNQTSNNTTDTNLSNTENSINENRKILKESNMKLLPTFSSRSIGTIQEGIEIKIEQEFNNWVQITAGSNSGWILKNNISGYQKNQETKPEEPIQVTIDANTEIPEKEQEPTQDTQATPSQPTSTDYKSQEGYINTDTVRVRQTAGGKIIGNMDINDKVTIVGEEGDWYKITCTKFPEGYISKSLITIGTISSRSSESSRTEDAQAIENAVEEFVKQEQQPAQEEVPVQPESAPVVEVSNKGQEIVDYAKGFLGSRYVSGGTSPNGFDCSGFTQYVYSHFGYSLARVASGQASNGTEVARTDLQLGDILVFQDYGRTCIGHVGIYIGDGNFIHAANPSRGVVIDNLNSNSYYNVRYVCARRII